MLAVQPENPMSNANEMCPRVRGEGTEGGLGSSGKTTWRKYYLSWAWLHKQHRWAEWMGKSCRCSTELCWLIAFTPSLLLGHTTGSPEFPHLPVISLPTCSALSVSPSPFHSNHHPTSLRKPSRWLQRRLIDLTALNCFKLNFTSSLVLGAPQNKHFFLYIPFSV